MEANKITNKVFINSMRALVSTGKFLFVFFSSVIEKEYKS